MAVDRSIEKCRDRFSYVGKKKTYIDESQVENKDVGEGVGESGGSESE